MNRQVRTQLSLGIFLILLRAWFLLDRSFPVLQEIVGKADLERTNPDRLDDTIRSLEIAYTASIDVLGKT